MHTACAQCPPAGPVGTSPLMLLLVARSQAAQRLRAHLHAKDVLARIQADLLKELADEALLLRGVCVFVSVCVCVRARVHVHAQLLIQHAQGRGAHVSRATAPK